MHLLASLSLHILLQTSGWSIFEDTKFDWIWSDEYQSHIEIPTFSSKLKKLEGQKISLTGHYMPMDFEENRIIISKQPFSSCFFCGGAGPETVAEVFFESEQRRFKADELITIRGVLKLNKYDYDHMVFMIMDAEELE